MIGRLKEQTLYLTWKHPEGWGSPTRYFYAPVGATVEWDGVSDNKGYEYCYGGKRVLWCSLPAYGDIGLEYDEVEWEE